MVETFHDTAVSASSQPVPGLIQVEHLSIRFDGAVRNIVDDVSFAVAPRKILAIVGESGCGKSLTALALMGLLPKGARVISGRAMFDGTDLLTLSPRRWADVRGGRIAMIFQEPMTSLNPMFTVGDQIAEAVRRHSKLPPKAAMVRARDLLRLVRIADPDRRLKSFPHEMSGGMRQRVMIAMALANNPSLLIADEPTTALDVTIQAQILTLIKDLQRETGAAVILITHDLGVVAENADDVAVMYAGHVVESGPVTAIFESPQHPYTIALMGATPLFAGNGGRLVAIPGTVPQLADMPRGCRFETRCPFAVPQCAAAKPELRQIGEAQAAACIRAPIEEHVS